MNITDKIRKILGLLKTQRRILMWGGVFSIAVILAGIKYPPLVLVGLAMVALTLVICWRYDVKINKIIKED
jgi:hypothetical protein